MENREQFGTNTGVPEGLKQVVILGAGVSGLSLAYYLLKMGGFEVIILEKANMVGGNCRTYTVNLNQNGQNQRWADMGVNDYNRATYKMLNELMLATGYGAGNPLEDTECFSNNDGSICYTNDGAYYTQMPADIKSDSERFQKEGYDDWKNPKYAYYTLGDYVAEKGYSDDFIYNNLYARVNGMYFCGGAPAEMPFRGVMSYYSLQEGYGGTPDRRYFTGGSSSWISTLLDAVVKMGGKLYTNIDATVVVSGQVTTVRYGSTAITPYATVLAMNADDALKTFGDSSNVPADVLDLLLQFEYITDEAVVHTDTRTLSPQQNSWRTYNIHIFDSKNFNYGPYTITYVANRHQNDCANPQYQGICENPQFLISLNPTTYPETNSILPQTNGQPAVTTFRHQKLSLNFLRAQDKLPTIQGKYGLWYVNGYAKGAGLHEECLIHSSDIALKIAGLPVQSQAHFDLRPEAPQYAPDYVLNAHKK